MGQRLDESSFLYHSEGVLPAIVHLCLSSNTFIKEIEQGIQNDILNILKKDPFSEEDFEKNKEKITKEEYKILIEKWKELTKEYFFKPDDILLNDREMKTSRFLSDIEDLHGVSFKKNIIPQMINEIQEKHLNKKMKILDLGCGMGFFSDELRTSFGENINVFSTNISKGNDKKYKRKKIENMRQSSDENHDLMNKLNLIGHDDEAQEKNIFHKNDGKWRSILEMTNYPEFDLIIDTYGEIFYSGLTNMNSPENFNDFVRIISMSIEKLKQGGKLYIGALSEHQGKLLQSKKNELEQEKNITINIQKNNKKLLYKKDGIDVTNGLFLYKAVITKK